MAFAAVLNFTKSVILGPSGPCMANIYLQIIFAANRSRYMTQIHLFLLSRILDYPYDVMSVPHLSPLLHCVCLYAIHAGPESWRIGLIRFLAGWRKRPLKQALVSLCLVLRE